VSKPWNGIGLRGNASGPISIQNCHVDADARLTAEGEGFKSMMESLFRGFSGSAAVSIGIAEASFANSIAHASAARFEHLKDSLASAVPGIRARLAQMRIGIDSARAYLDTRCHGSRKVRPTSCSLLLGAKANAGRNAIRVTDDAMRVCGGAAFSRDLTIERNFRDARPLRYGADDGCPLTILSAKPLRLPLF